MNYYGWGAIEKETNLTACSTKSQLIDRIKVVFEAIPRDTVNTAFARFSSRIEAVVGAEGLIFELIVFWFL